MCYKTFTNTLDHSQNVLLSTTCTCVLQNVHKHTGSFTKCCNTVHHLCMLQNVHKHTRSFTKCCTTVHHLCMLQNIHKHTRSFTKCCNTVHHLCMLQNVHKHARSFTKYCTTVLSTTCVCYKTFTKTLDRSQNAVHHLHVTKCSQTQ